MSSLITDVELVGAGWAAFGTTQARGSAHLGERYLAAADMAELLDACSTELDWQSTLARLNGCLAVISRRGPVVLAAVDRLRTMPLFYSDAGGRRLVSDSAHRIRDGHDSWKIEPVADVEFQSTGYVTGADTLVAGLRQLQAGEVLRWDAQATGGPERWQYFQSRHGDYVVDAVPDLVSQLDRVHRSVFRRLVQSAGDRTIVVPLSGGYDSRLIGVSLRDLGVRDVVCYSYGLSGNWEAGISRELARYLGFRWEFVPYSPQQWRTWAATASFKTYCRFAGNLTSVPHIQDWPAVAELHRGQRIPPGSIFVPGHSGDFVAGSHIPRQFMGRRSIPRREVLDSVLRSHYSLWQWPAPGRHELADEFDKRIESIVGTISQCSPETAADLFERWDLQERQAKFICNSVRVYEDFGYEWRLPLFDHELMNFWARIPVELRVGRKLYLRYVQERQHLPVTSANTDHNRFMAALVRGIDAAGLKPLAQRAQRSYRAMRWRRDYETSSLGWNSIVDREYFRRTYTGTQILHSYLTLAYRDSVVESIDRVPGRQIIPALCSG